MTTTATASNPAVHSGQANRLGLTPEQVAQYRDRGYITGIDVFTPAEVTTLNRDLMELARHLAPGETLIDTREWHESSRWLYDVCTEARVLDRVQSLLGLDFYLWACQFFAKEPYSPTTVAWHQDAYYWPLKPHKSVTAWIAFLDSDDANGAMRVIPASHRGGPIRHKRSEDDSVLSFATDDASFNAADAVTLKLRAGQMSLHDDNIIHGSEANRIGHWRIGLTIRYSAAEVQHTTATPDKPFITYLVRGEDRHRYPQHAQGKIPTERFARRDPVRDSSQRR